MQRRLIAVVYSIVSMQDISDAVLVKRCRLGDNDAQAVLYRKYRPMMLKVARRVVDDETAHDVVHDAIIMALTSLESLQQPEKVSSWLRSITHNIALNHVKHQQIVAHVPLENVHEQLADHVDDTPLLPLEALTAMVNRLPQGYARVFRLNSLDGLNHRQISELLNISESTSRSQLAHARSMLRTMIKHYWMPILLMAIALFYWLKDKSSSRPEATQPIVAQESAVVPIDTTANDPESVNTKPLLSLREAPASSTRDIEEMDTVLRSTPINAELSDTVLTEDTTVVQPVPQLKVHPLPEQLHLAKAVPASSTGWSVSLAFNGAASTYDHLNRNYSFATSALTSDMTVVPTGIPDTINNWVDYYHYLDCVKSSDENRSLYRIVEQNVLSNPSPNIEQREHHDLPWSVELSVNKVLSPHWSVGSGLRYTRLRSTIDYGFEQAYVVDQQTIHHLGIPLNIYYKAVNHARWSVYGTAGTTLDVPIHATLVTRHVLLGEQIYHHSDAVSVPLQWSMEAGVGLQYQIAPHVGVFLQPGVRYYFDNGTKTIRSAHRWNVTIPAGLRLTW